MNFRKLFLILLTFSFLLPIYGEEKKIAWPKSFTDIDIKKSEQLIKTGQLVLIDVRTDGEYKHGHLDSAKHMDFWNKNFKSNVEKLDKDKNYLVYCAVGGRSKKAMLLMQQMKFKRVYNMQGGYKGWSKQGLKTVK